jgi:hypothetical protein
MIIMAKAIKYCEIYSGKVCDNCNECNICDLDPNKLCDSCGKCIGLTEGTDYLEVNIDGILDEDWEAEEYITEEESLGAQYDESEEVEEFEFDYIEDIPELKKEYDKKIDEILHGKKKEKHNH